MSRFDFSSFAFNPNGPTDPKINANLPPRIERKAVVIPDSTDESSNGSDVLKTRSGRRVQAKNDLKTLISSDEEDFSDEDEDEFKANVANSNKPQRKPRVTKDKNEDDHDIVNGFKPLKKSNKLSNKKDDQYDISAFKPLKKTNRSITINNDHNDSLSKPLKNLKNKINNEDKTNQYLPDEINALLELNDSLSTDSFTFKKKRQQGFSDDDDDVQPKKKSKRKRIVSSDEEDDQDDKSDKRSNEDDGQEDLQDDIQVVLDEDQTDENYESDEDLLTSDDDDEEEESSKKGKSKKFQIKEAVMLLCNEGKEAELLSITGFNKKCYDELVNLREFTDWASLLKKFENSVNLGTDTIERLSDYIKTKNVISTIMDKCQELSDRIKKSVSNLKEHKEPRCLNKKLKLKPYQLVGLNYLVMMYKQNLNSILADEMGLGKTIQVIALLAYLREECNIFGSHLIVVPSSILSNWEREFELWCPKIKILKYYGNQDERAQLRYDIITKSVDFDVVLTTYNMLYSGDDKKLLTRVKFQYAVFDEAHMLKNMKSSRFKNLFAVKAKYRLMLTGTPIQNNLLELISLLTFTVPNLFYSKLNFMENFFKNKKFDDNSSQFVQEKTDQAKDILKPFILRRIKENVLKDLPNKVEQYVELDMTEDQLTLYRNVVAKHSEQLKARKERKEREKTERFEDKVEIFDVRNRKKTKKEYNENKIFYVEGLDRPRKNGNQNNVDEVVCLDDDSNQNDVDGQMRRIELIDINSESSSSDIWRINGKEDDKQIKERQGSILMELRKCANHPLLIRNLYTSDLLLKMAQILKRKEPYYQKDGNVKFMVEDMELLNDFDLHMLCKKFPCISEFQLEDKHILESGKFKYLDTALLDFKEKDQKVLIFSQFVMMLDIIEEYLKIKKIKFCRLDGSTSVTSRQCLIDTFKDKEIFAFLLTTKAGGVGINLVEANNVIIHDSDWNPFNDLQAESRAHRIGQTQEVNVYKLVSKESVEVHIRQICEDKLVVGKKITSDQVEKAKNEESSNVKLLLKKALNY